MAEWINEGFRLSPQQKHLWLLQQIDQNPAFRAQCVIAIEGDLEEETLKQALKQVVNRYDTLRTTFPIAAGMKIPFQVLADTQMLSWRSIDLTEFAPAIQTFRAKEIFETEGGLPYDLERGPLLHLILLKLSRHSHTLIATLPALCIDSYALNNLVYEVSRSYSACTRGEILNGEGQSYVQFSEWQNELLEDQDDNTGKNYWRNQDTSSILSLTIPFERKPSEMKRFKPEVLSFTAKADVVRNIHQLLRRYELSESVFLLTCWQVLIWRLTGQSVIVIGTLFEGRIFEELKTAIGLFAKVLPIRCQCEDASKFTDILRQTSDAMHAAHEWQAYFTPGQIEHLARTGMDTTSFPVAFEFEQQALEYFAAGVSFRIGKQYVCLDRFKLKLHCRRTGDALATEFEYDPCFFSTDEINRLADQYHTLINSVIREPEMPIGKIEILSSIQRRQLLIEFTDTKAGYFPQLCVHQLFEQQVDRKPQNVAVAYEDQQLTYNELNTRANQLANYLCTFGVGPEVRVALWVDRSLDMIIGLLAILKAGAVYVPLEPTLPIDRLKFILEDTDARVLLTQHQLLESNPIRAERVVCLDTEWHLVAKHSGANLTAKAVLENLAYVIYTSGSTGNPKGVAVEHRQLLNYLNGVSERLELSAGASFATVSSLGADLGNTAIFPALCTGGSLHVVSQERSVDPDAIADYFQRHPVDCLKIVPSHLNALLTTSHAEHILPRKRLVLGGEACDWPLIDKVHALAPNCAILNHYGPTETTIGVTTYRMETDPIAGERLIRPPIGRPIANTQLFILDSHLQPVPIWVTGELYIGGDGLARGYLNRPELTAQKFIANPFSDNLTARLYATGDLARWLPDGNIEYIGRIDNQVKIRGFRIEPGEIQTALAQLPAVRENVVIARCRDGGETQLVAYVVPTNDQILTTNDLRSFLKSKLPDYMVPSAFVFLHALPLTSTGKIDRNALPPVGQEQLAVRVPFVAPQSDIEKTLCSIWSDLLKLENVGINDNFFALGGQSLLAAQAICRIRDAFQVQLRLQSLFNSATLVDLAEHIETIRWTTRGMNASPERAFANRELGEI